MLTFILDMLEFLLGLVPAFLKFRKKTEDSTNEITAKVEKLDDANLDKSANKWLRK